MFDVTKIKDPSFIKKLNIKELEALAFDIREFIIKKDQNYQNVVMKFLIKLKK